MKCEKPTEEMIKTFYKNYKGSVMLYIVIFTILAIVTTGFFILSIIAKLAVKYIIFAGVIAFAFIFSMQSYISTLRKMKRGDFTVTRVFYGGISKYRNSPTKITVNYINDEGVMETKKYDYMCCKREKPIVKGEEITVAIFPDNTLYML